MIGCLDITLLEQCIQEWKGDEHTHGIYFTDHRGYMLNKVLAIRFHHHKRVEADLFYSFRAFDEDGSPMIESTYPYENMAHTPKKHHLLFKDQHVSKSDIDQLFTVNTDKIKGMANFKPGDLYDALDQVSNSRDRERAICAVEMKKEHLYIVVYRYINRIKRVLLHEKIAAEATEHFSFATNSHTMHCVLKIFYHHPSVHVQTFGDRILITNAAGEESHNPKLEVLIAQVKGRL